MPEIAGPEPGTASVGAKDLGATGKLPGSRTAYTKTGLPASGGTVYVRFQYKKDGVWHLVADYQYTAARN